MHFWTLRRSLNENLIGTQLMYIISFLWTVIVCGLYCVGARNCTSKKSRFWEFSFCGHTWSTARSVGKCTLVCYRRISKCGVITWRLIDWLVFSPDVNCIQSMFQRHKKNEWQPEKDCERMIYNFSVVRMFVLCCCVYFSSNKKCFYLVRVQKSHRNDRMTKTQYYFIRLPKKSVEKV